MLGGWDGSSINYCEKYSLPDNTWYEISKMSQQKQNVSACIFNNKYIFAIGGFNKKQYLSDIEKYDINHNQWEVFQISQQYTHFLPRDLAFSHQLNDSSILIAGGKNEKGKLKDSLMFDVSDKSFKVGKGLPMSDYFISSSSIIVSNHLYAFGHSKKQVYKFNLDDMHWDFVLRIK